MKRYRIQTFSLVIIAVTLILSSCATKFDKSFPPLNGMIYDADNKPVTAVTLSIDGETAATSDIQGHFALSTLLKGKNYFLEASRKGYETTATFFSYTNPTQVLHLRIVSGEQLVDEAELAISEKNWADASSFLDRAELAECDSLASGYLRAVILVETGKSADAATLLENLRTSGEREPYIDLFLADLYQYYLDQPELSAEALRRFLFAKSDSEVEKRLVELQKINKIIY